MTIIDAVMLACVAVALALVAITGCGVLVWLTLLERRAADDLQTHGRELAQRTRSETSRIDPTDLREVAP